MDLLPLASWSKTRQAEHLASARCPLLRWGTKMRPRFAHFCVGEEKRACALVKIASGKQFASARWSKTRQIRNGLEGSCFYCSKQFSSLPNSLLCNRHPAYCALCNGRSFWAQAVRAMFVTNFAVREHTCVLFHPKTGCFVRNICPHLFFILCCGQDEFLRYSLPQKLSKQCVGRSSCTYLFLNRHFLLGLHGHLRLFLH